MPPRLIEFVHGSHVVSTDRARVDVEAVHRWISVESYWAPGRSFETQRRAIEHSALVVGAYAADGDQVGFARMVTDLATFAWLADVYVVDEARGAGLGAAMVRAIVEHPDVVTIKRQLLATADAHDLYARFGYEPLAEPDRWMFRLGPT
ncbi:MAG: GNAT family N-acetyltransferase [Ilumatobacteraceae bacterium]|nr:GNAT family N-acetyltransferase [Ilumatobacteraceae bacterium]